MNNRAPAPSSPLSIAVIGVGGIGSTFAYHLARAGHHVTVVARPGSARLRQLRRDLGIVHKTGERAQVGIADRLDEQAAYDLVLVTALAHQVDAILPSLHRSQARAVQFMFNTFDPESLAAAVGPHRCSFGMPFVMARLVGDGQLDSTINPGQKTLHGDARWVALFAGAGIPSAFERDMPLWLRCHTPLCIAMESICVTAQRRGGGSSWAEALVVARGLHGGFAIVKGLGDRLYPRSKSVLDACPDVLLASLLWVASRIPSFRDLLATGAVECGALIDVVGRAAADAGPGLAAAVASLDAARPLEPTREPTR